MENSSYQIGYQSQYRSNTALENSVLQQFQLESYKLGEAIVLGGLGFLAGSLLGPPSAVVFGAIGALAGAIIGEDSKKISLNYKDGSEENPLSDKAEYTNKNTINYLLSPYGINQTIEKESEESGVSKKEQCSLEKLVVKANSKNNPDSDNDLKYNTDNIQKSSEYITTASEEYDTNSDSQEQESLPSGENSESASNESSTSSDAES